MTVHEQQFEGELRYVNSRLITNCEEIAFYNGNRREKLIVYDAFQRLVDDSFKIRRHSARVRFRYIRLDQTFTKFNHISICHGLHR
jgi:ABC-type uncharacterized transport system fused permease/ATPase subunit